MTVVRSTGLLVLLAGIAGGCGEEKAPEGRLNDVGQAAGAAKKSEDLSTTVEISRAPVGRTALPTLNTGAGPLFISLPGEFSVRADSGYHADLIFLYRTEDPVVEGDLSSPPIAIARLHISDSTINLRMPGQPAMPMKTLVAGIPTTFEHSVNEVPGTGLYHSYSTELRNFFAPRDPNPSISELNLHLYVGGSDTATLSTLLQALSTISFQP